MDAQKERLVILHIRPSGASQAAISAVTEAGIVAKTARPQQRWRCGVFERHLSQGRRLPRAAGHVALRSALEARYIYI